MVKLTLREKESIQEAVRRFRKLVERNAINYHSPGHMAHIIYCGDAHDIIVEKINAIIQQPWEAGQ